MKKEVNALHIIYLIIIFAIVLLSIWLCAPYLICEESLLKFEFAATITSIILAVISITYTMSSSGSISQNLGSMRDSSDKISKVGDGMTEIKDSIAKDIERLNIIEGKMDNALSYLSNIKQNMESNRNNIPPNTSSESPSNFSFANASIAGKIIIYACGLSSKKNKPIPATLLGNPSYAHGYITALEVCAPSHFRARGEADMRIHVALFDESFFEPINKEHIEEQINNYPLYSQMKPMFEQILTFFGEQ